jgi:flagellar biosynthesis protein FliP
MTILGFVIFSITYNTPQHRLSICGILILTAVNFRWIISTKLPSVSYLTFMDYFSLGGIFIQITFCLWFAVVGVGLVTSDTSLAKTIENYVLYGLAGAYALFLVYVVCTFIWVELYKARFQRKSSSELKKSQTMKQAFAKGLASPEVQKDKLDKKLKEANHEQSSLSKSGVNPVIISREKQTV